MKKTWILVLLSLAFYPVFGQSGYDITVHLQHIRQGTLYLGNYYGKNTFIVDSTVISDQGTARFQGEAALPGGIYFILLPGKQKYFECLIDEQQHFEITADSSKNFANLAFKGSSGNMLFLAYNRFLAAQQTKIDSAKPGAKDSIAIANLEHKRVKAIDRYRQDIIDAHPKSLLALLFRAMKDPVVPKKPANNSDSAFAYHYFRSHYWDHIDFSDNRIVRSPILEIRLQRYFTQLVPQVPDSINQAADALLTKVDDKEVFKYMLWWLTSTYERSPYMGMDAVFVHLVEKYYVSGKAYWVQSDQLQKIVDKAAKIAPNLIGNIAPPLTFVTTAGQTRQIADINAKYTVLVFWDPTCGHCQTVVPRLDSAYESSWKKEGVKIVGLLAGGTKTQWLDFIKEHQLDDWINAQVGGDNSYRRLYDVYMTPVIYLLDAQKKIRAKQLTVDQLDSFIRNDSINVHP